MSDIETLRKIAGYFLQGEGCTQEVQDAVYAAADELQRLRAIVRRLPKTADGVPIYPGMTLWAVEDRPYHPNAVCADEAYGVLMNRLCDGYRIVLDAAFHNTAKPGIFYSTREAAEAAAKEEG